jgi:hypothetical protein
MGRTTVSMKTNPRTIPLKKRQRGYLKRNVHRNVLLGPIPNLPPLQGGSVSLGVFPGLKPWASMKPSLSRPAAKIVFFLFLVHFGRPLAITDMFGFGA